MPAVSLKNIVRKYGEKKALDNVSFDCAENSRTVIIGPSGAGKTTCLKLIAGLETADEGSLYIDGRDASSLKPHERNIGMIFQDAALFPHSTVYDNIAYGMHRLGYNKDDIRKMVQETAEHLHIESLLKRYPGSLSAGERQRAGIARAIVRKPGLLLLDEPFANLDARLREELQKEIISLQKEYGMTMLLITHDQSEAVAMGQYLIFMEEGKVIDSGPVRKVAEDPRDLRSAMFIGSPAVNTSPVSETKDGPMFFGIILNVSLQGRNVIGAVRPEKMFLTEEGRGFACTVQSVTHGYRESTAECMSMYGPLRITGTDFAEKQILHVSFHEEDVMLFDAETKERIRLM